MDASLDHGLSGSLKVVKVLGVEYTDKQEKNFSIGLIRIVNNKVDKILTITYTVI